jgi:hypothetical protein
MPTVEDKLREMTGTFVEQVLQVYNRDPELLERVKTKLGNHFVAALDNMLRTPSVREQISSAYHNNPVMRAVAFAAYESQRKPEDKIADEEATKFRVSQVTLEKIEAEIQRQIVEAGP